MCPPRRTRKIPYRTYPSHWLGTSLSSESVVSDELFDRHNLITSRAYAKHGNRALDDALQLLDVGLHGCRQFLEGTAVGDILINDKEALFFCLHKMSDFFIENLIRVKHTTVLVSRVEQAEEIPEPEFEMINGTCASVRLDALIGLAFQTSRSSMVSFIESGLVFVNGKLITSNGYEPKEGDIISVRGKGRFIYDGVSRQTKKGRLGVRIRKYV